MNNLIRLKVSMTIIFISLCATSLHSQIRTASIFSNNMVLQQSTDANIWGWDKPAQKIKVRTSWNNKEYTANSDSDGKWLIKLQTPSAGGPYRVTVKGSSTLIFENVLIGEVWLCSGQSNMQMPVKGYQNQPVINSQEAILNSQNEYIREFAVKRTYSRKPQDKGVVASLFRNQRILWDPGKMKVANIEEANAIIYPEFRNGWEIL